jgi:hypothetical protein
MDTDYIKSFKDLTLEFGRGETYCSGRPTLYGHSTYGRSSVLAGQSRRVFLEDWDDLETAKAELAAAKIRFTNICGSGSTHVPVDSMVSHLPDEGDY